MKKLAAGLAAALMVAVGANVYQAVPDKASSAPKHSYAYQRVDRMWAAFQRGDYKAGCDVLAWYSVNQLVTQDQCAEIMAAEFPKSSKLIYRVVGEHHGSARYTVVTVVTAVDDPTTKGVDESAVCAAAWADGKDCKFSGAYTFGVALIASPLDTFKNTKKAVQHWYVMWVD